MICFKAADLQRELNALDAIAKSYLALGSRDHLKQLSDRLERIRVGGQPAVWEIAVDAPLETKVSLGEYQPSAGTSREVFAQIEMIWDVRPIDGRLIEVHDRSSTRVRFISKDVLGVLSMDLGDADAPGCFFHVQVSGAGDEETFPSDFDVPRLPTLVATPASVVEFVLSELFQKDWRRHASAHASRGVWLSSQRSRWERYLDWQKGQVEVASFSPWVELKESVPEAGLFC